MISVNTVRSAIRSTRLVHLQVFDRTRSEAIPSGDGICAVIAAASIIASVRALCSLQLA